MPELPEVETTLKGIKPYISGQKIIRLIVRQESLRWPVTPQMPSIVEQQTVIEVSRRAKYLIIQLSHGSILVHLGHER